MEFLFLIGKGKTSLVDKKDLAEVVRPFENSTEIRRGEAFSVSD